jgi:hypothetical protein
MEYEHKSGYSFVNGCPNPIWAQACMQEYKRLLTGVYGHFCEHHAGKPIDETCPEWPCSCYNGDTEE